MTLSQQGSSTAAGTSNKLTSRANLRLGTAIAGALAVAALFPGMARAQEECGAPDDGTVTCSPDGNPYPDGITYVAPPGDLTIVLEEGVVIDTTGGPNNGVLALGIGDGAITLDGGTDTSITTDASGANGILGATTDGALTVTADQISTTGASAGGIFASSATGLTTVSANEITTAGIDADGITANTNSGDVVVDAGTIVTSGDGAMGVRATSDGADVTVTVEDISTSGDATGFLDPGANGVLATAGGMGDVTVDAGTVTTTGIGAVGIRAQTFNGTVSVAADTVATSGADADGISVNSTGGTAVVDAGTITTAGANADGIAATGLTGVDLTFDSITTTGDNAVGVLVPAAAPFQGIRPTATVAISGGEITTSGTNADGIRAFATDTATLDVTGDIATSGDGARGVFVTATNGVTVAGSANVTTSGDNANGVDVSSTAGPIDLTVGDVSTSGDLSGGVRAIGGVDSDVSVTTGNVTTTGTAGSNYSFLPTSTAIVATAQGTGNVTVDAGDVSTAGLGAAGVNATAATGDASVTTGDIATSGNRANGVTAQSFGGDVAVTTGTVSTTGDTSAGIYAVARAGEVSVDADAISTEGFNARGINAIAGAGGADVAFTSVEVAGTFSSGISAISTGGDVVVSGADIATTGTSNYALYASSDVGNVDVTTTGDVSSSGRGSTGIFASSDTGDVSVTANNVSVVAADDADTETTRRAIFASGANADVVVTGSVSTTGSALYGGSADAVTVVATGGDANVSVTDVSTTGTNADAVDVTATGMATVDATGAVSTTGDYSRGIIVRSGTDATITGAGSISTSGADANAIDVATTDGSIDIVQGNVSTAGDRSQGVRAIAGGAGDVTLAVGNVTTTGTAPASFFFLPNSTAVFARAGDGAIDITTGDVSTVADGARGIDAQATGDVGVAAGSVATTGARANGISATSYGGDVVVSSTGTISTEGDQSYGVYAVARGGGVTVDATDVATAGFAADGIAATGGTGGVDVGFGSVTTEGTFADGVSASATDGDVVVSGADVTTTGDASFAIVADATGGDVTVTTTGTVSSSGRGAGGIYAYSDTGVATVNVDDVTVVAADEDDVQTTRAGVTATGASAVVTSTGTVTTAGEALYGGSAVGVQVTGTAGSASATVNNVTTTGNGAQAVLVDATGGGASVTVNGTVRTSGEMTDAVVVTSDQDVTVTNNGAISTGSGDSNGIVATSGTGSTIVNAGTLAGGDYALLVNGGPATVTNSGTLNGRILLTDGDDTVTNSGRFVLTGDSDFGAGADAFSNSGTITSGLGTAGSVGFLGLETLTSSGLIDLRNERTGDVLSTSGDFVGADGRLGVDVNLATNVADRLVIGGSATGSTSVVLNVLDNGPVTLATDTTIVQTGAGSAADAFTLDPVSADQGLVQLGIVFDPDDSTFNLEAAPGAAVFRTGAFAGSLRNLWLQSADAWSGQTRALRDNVAANGAGATGGRVWLQGYGQREEYDSSRAITVGGVTTNTDIGAEQDYFGVQGGIDLGGSAGEGGFAFGVTGGYLNSNLGFNGTADRINFDVVNVGAYASYTSGAFFVNALGKYDHYWGENRSRSGRYEIDMDGAIYGAKAEAGLRLGGDLWIEPAVSLAYTHVDIDDFDVAQGSFAFDADEGLRGKAGARIGHTFGTEGGTRVQAYIGGNYVHEFEGRDRVTFVSGGQTVSFTQDRPEDYGEATLGVNIGSDGGAMSGFFEGRYATGGDYHGYGARAGIRFRF